MAELLLRKGNHGRALSCRDGDIVCAMNDRRIKDVHTQTICKNNRHLLEFYLSKVRQFKFERISETEVRRINLWDSTSEIFDDTPNAEGKAIDVPLFIQRRLKNPKHKIFGSQGNEVWYGGRTNASIIKLKEVWKEIETKTSFKESEHTKWPFSEYEKTNFVIIKTDDFDDITRDELVSSIYNPITEELIKKRKHRVNYQSIRKKEDVQDRKSIVEVKT